MPDASSQPKQSRQAERSAATRTALLLAAEQVFARDGFEAARIEDIAQTAGRSRGAFYANFETKTELFLALREQLARKRAREIHRSIKDLPDEASRDRAIKAYLVQKVLKERQLLLEIEFKLFAVRRPALLKDLASKHLEAGFRIHKQELAPYIPEWRGSDDATRRNTLAIEAILEGLTLNHLFHGSVLTAADVSALLPGLIDRVMVSPCGAESPDGCAPAAESGEGALPAARTIVVLKTKGKARAKR